MHIIALVTAALLHFDVERILAFGIIVWIFNHLGLSEKATLIGNIIAMVLIFAFVFIF